MCIMLYTLLHKWYFYCECRNSRRGTVLKSARRECKETLCSRLADSPPPSSVVWNERKGQNPDRKMSANEHTRFCLSGSKSLKSRSTLIDQSKQVYLDRCQDTYGLDACLAKYQTQACFTPRQTSWHICADWRLHLIFRQHLIHVRVIAELSYSLCWPAVHTWSTRKFQSLKPSQTSTAKVCTHL